MLGKNLTTLFRRASQCPKFNVPKRDWGQVGIVIVTPPRNPCSYAEKVVHGFFMYSVWLFPVAWFMTQLKVWRREYIQSG